jgi:hypothetical protein
MKKALAKSGRLFHTDEKKKRKDFDVNTPGVSQAFYI